MEDQQYPEILPEVSPLDETFAFSLSVGKEQRKDLELRIQALETRISRIVDKMQKVTGDLPIFAQILNFIKDPEDLRILGNALVKVSPMMQELNTYRRRYDAFVLAEEEPDFFRWAFGDFSSSFKFDNFFDSYFQDTDLKQEPSTFSENNHPISEDL